MLSVFNISIHNLASYAKLFDHSNNNSMNYAQAKGVYN